MDRTSRDELRRDIERLAAGDRELAQAVGRTAGSGIDQVAGGLFSQLFEQTEVSRQSFPERIAPLTKDVAHVHDCVFACHDFTYLGEPIVGQAKEMAPLRLSRFRTLQKMPRSNVL